MSSNTVGRNQSLAWLDPPYTPQSLRNCGARSDKPLICWLRECRRAVLRWWQHVYLRGGGLCWLNTSLPGSHVNCFVSRPLGLQLHSYYTVKIESKKQKWTPSKKGFQHHFRPNPHPYKHVWKHILHDPSHTCGKLTQTANCVRDCGSWKFIPYDFFTITSLHNIAYWLFHFFLISVTATRVGIDIMTSLMRQGNGITLYTVTSLLSKNKLKCSIIA